MQRCSHKLGICVVRCKTGNELGVGHDGLRFAVVAALHMTAWVNLNAKSASQMTVPRFPVG